MEQLIKTYTTINLYSAFHYSIKPLSAKHFPKLFKMRLHKQKLLFVALWAANKRLVALDGELMPTTFGDVAY